ncbi:MAG: S4 domain-containing protein YaaA [Bacilli bacterium]|nr:S4 domain-containing protein YaaA [Bacilli bacterium]
MAKEVKITTDYITLGQFLKYVGIIDSGFLAKIFLNDHEVYINGELDTRRGKKLYPGDLVLVEKVEYIIK